VNLAELGEFGLIGRIARAVSSRADVVTGIGDDAAVTIPVPGNAQLTTTDMLLEGVHFDLAFTPPRLLGHKALAVNLSDIAAMGGVPRHCYLALALPPGMTVEFVDEFMAGLLELGERHDVVLAGGDTCASRSGLVISLTVVGEQAPERVVGRGGARSGDQIFVTGVLGDSALGLRLLRQGVREGGAVQRHLAPIPRLAEGRMLAERGLASAMIDISDGLLSDLGHICRRSAVGALVELPLLPLSAEFRAVAAVDGAAVADLPLSGGEDYELLFTVPPERAGEVGALFAAAGTPVSRIGEISAGRLLVRDGHGEISAPRQRGFDHFPVPVPEPPTGPSD
jgi:thiamine-monophosphate kinase